MLRTHRTRFQRGRIGLAAALCAAGLAATARPADAPQADARKGLKALLAHPIREAPFPDVVRACTGRRVIPFDPKADADRLARLSRAMADAAAQAREKGVRARRPNEAGNAMEAFVRRALRGQGFEAGVPRTVDGRRQVAGYPDVEIKDRDGRVIYLEVKIFSARTARTTQRSFYFSPTAHSKILTDASHLLAGFEMTRERGEKGYVFRPTGWKLVDLSTLRVKLKLEFNASNRRLYGEARVLSEGR